MRGPRRRQGPFVASLSSLAAESLGPASESAFVRDSVSCESPEYVVSLAIHRTCGSVQEQRCDSLGHDG